MFYFLPLSYIYFQKQGFPDSFVTKGHSSVDHVGSDRRRLLPLHHYHHYITITSIPLPLSFIIVIDPFRCSGRKKYPVKTMIIIITHFSLSLSLLYLYLPAHILRTRICVGTVNKRQNIKCDWTKYNSHSAMKEPVEGNIFFLLHPSCLDMRTLDVS